MTFSRRAMLLTTILPSLRMCSTTFGNNSSTSTHIPHQNSHRIFPVTSSSSVRCSSSSFVALSCTWSAFMS
ncbi:hypothetical protein EDD15DRAFT_2330786 [Pisolithus albus]|nr:hypothetical protein EDD15DRAFT_2330786 [Pisolithus albus]